MKTFILYWRGGDVEKVYGETITDALKQTGYLPIIDSLERYEEVCCAKL